MRKMEKPTDSHTNIRLGKLERKILKYLSKIDNERFNIKAISKLWGIQRSTIYSSLDNLKLKGLIEREDYGHHTITKKGILLLDALGTNPNRTGCRTAPQISEIRDHKFTFKVSIKSKPDSWGNSVGLLDKHGIQTKLINFSKNNPLLHTKFPDDVDVAFTTSHVIIKPKNIFELNHSSASFKAVSKAHEILIFLIDLGFNFNNEKGILPLIQTEGHYAEVNSILGQFFEKTAKGFSVKDSDGKQLFWIDHSNGNLEDETASEDARERLGKHMRDVMENDNPTISEINEDLKDLKSITSDLVYLELIRQKALEEKDNYENYELNNEIPPKAWERGIL